MSTIRGVKDRRFKFVQLLNSMFEDPNLSLKAKGFIGYCLTKPEGWKFHISHLEKVLKEGECSIYSTMNECIDNGYAIRYQTRKPDGEFACWETIVSDSKEEIVQLKKDLEKDPGFKKFFTLRGFPVAENPVPENRGAVVPSQIPADLYSNTDQSNTDSYSVCAESPPVGADPLLEIEKVEIKGFDGHITKVSKSDVFTRACQQRLPWTAEDIEDAWNVLINYNGNIRDWWEFLKGTINNQRKFKSIRNLETGNKKCQTYHKKKQQNSEEEKSKKQQESSEEQTSEIDTWTRGLPDWNSQALSWEC